MYTFVMESERARLIQSEKMSAAANLLAGIVHELNNPLTTILGFSELLLREGKFTNPARLQKIHSEAERSVRIVQNVLRLARADSGGAEIIDINESIRRTVELAQYEIKLHQIQLTLNLAPREPKVIAHPGELTQVFLNLITNAIQAISAARASGTIEISSQVICDRVHVVVCDNGPGISEADRPRIFDAFFTTKETGTGLGLNLSRRIIREIGGEITAGGCASGGAVFTIELPVAIGTEDALHSTLDDTAIMMADHAVLIVDDEDHITELIDSVLQHSGYRTDCLNDGAQAIELLKQKEYDILICDLHMPGMSGRDLIEWSRVNRPNMRVLLLSGDVARTDTGEFARSCGAHFLSKPFNVSELSKAVQRLFS
jgi:two-component system NtrC family sensor kinase